MRFRPKSALSRFSHFETSNRIRYSRTNYLTIQSRGSSITLYGEHRKTLFLKLLSVQSENHTKTCRIASYWIALYDELQQVEITFQLTSEERKMD